MAVNLLKKNSLALVASLLLAGHVQATELLNSSYDVSRELFAALNPPFEQQCFQLNNYQGLSPKQPENTFAPGTPLQAYSRGMGAIGLPGDLSSESRFARVAFVKMNSKSGTSENESVSQFFHILNSVDQQRGCCEVAEDKYEITLYTSCCNAKKGIYYYTTYENHQITAVDMNKEDLNAKKLIRFPLVCGEQIRWQN